MLTFFEFNYHGKQRFFFAVHSIFWSEVYAADLAQAGDHVPCERSIRLQRSVGKAVEFGGVSMIINVYHYNLNSKNLSSQYGEHSQEF